MSTNNTQLNAPTVPSGQILPSFSDASGVNWIAGPPAYATTLSNTPGASVFAVVTLTNGLPVQPQAGSTWTVGGTVGVSGTVPISAASLPLPAGAATDATLSTLNGKVTACNTGAVVISAALPAGTNVLGHVVVDSGSVSVSNFPSTQNVSIVGQSGTVSVGVVGGVTVGGTVSVSNFPSTQAVSIASLPALAAGSNVIGGVTQSGTWDVVASGTVSITGTVPISAAALPLPAGASTSAKQPALGTAGSAAADVISVQGIAAMTPLKVDGSGVTQPVSGTVTANAGTGTFPVSAASLPLPTGASTSAKQPSIGTAGTPAADVITVQGSTGMTAVKVDGSAVTQPVSGTVTANAGTGTFGVSGTVTANAGTGTFATNLAQVAGSSVATGHGTAAGAIRVELPTDGTGLVNAAQSGTWNVGTVTTLTGITNALPAGTNLLGKVGIDQTTPGTTNAVQLVPGSTGGMSVSSFLSTGAVQSTSVKSSAGVVYALEFFNNSATPVYVRLYNQTTAPASTDGANIVWRGLVPGNTAGAGFVKSWDNGLAFSAGIGMRCTAGIADSDATALTASTVLGNVDYK